MSDIPEEALATAERMQTILNTYQYWVLGMEPKHENEDGSVSWGPREGFTWEECKRRQASMPARGKLDDLVRAAWEAALKEHPEWADSSASGS